MITKLDKSNFKNYLEEAKTWENSKVELLQKSVRNAWLVAIFAGIVAIIAVITVAILGPQKTSVPYVIRVDNVTGAVDIMKELDNGKTNYDEAMNKYNVQWYLRWREGYSKNTIEDYYKNVGIMSTPTEQTKYAQYISKSNPLSPLVIYGDSVAKVEIKVKSTSFIKKNIALIRFTKQEIDGGSSSTTHWAATITFEYAGTPMSEANRAINPLGFQVSEYRIDPDQEITENSLPSTKVKRVVPIADTTPAVPSIH